MPSAPDRLRPPTAEESEVRMSADHLDLPIQLATAQWDDATGVCEIYNWFIVHSTATFEETCITVDEMQRRMDIVASVGLPWWVARRGSQILGYAYANRWKERSGYRFSVETTVYLAHDQAGNGLGSRLYTKLFEELKQQGYRTAIGGIALPNPASVALHEKMGMHKVAHFESVGFKHDRWIDVGYWQKSL